MLLKFPPYHSKDTAWDKLLWKVKDFFLLHKRYKVDTDYGYKGTVPAHVVQFYRDENRCLITFHPFTIFVELNFFLETGPIKEHLLEIKRDKTELNDYLSKIILRDVFLSKHDPPIKPLNHLRVLTPWGINGDYENGKLRRVDLIVMALVVLKKKIREQECFKQVMLQNYFFELVPHPIVAVKEVRGFLHAVCGESKRCAVVEYYCDLFKKMFPKYPKDLQPRPLKHLCRCLIRKHLSQYGKKKQQVSTLEIPETLKAYILLDEEYRELCKSLGELRFGIHYEYNCIFNLVDKA